MLDGMTVETLHYKPHGNIVFQKKESMFDTEKESLYYSDYCFDVLITYRNPRNIAQIRKVRIHRNVTQLENFMWSQLPLPIIEELEKQRLCEFLDMQPSLIYWDFVLGIYHTAGWERVMESLGDKQILDERIIATKLFLGNYRWQDLLLKFYRINPERNFKYSKGLLGLTKAEIVCPIFYLTPIDQNLGSKNKLFSELLDSLHSLRRMIMQPFWKEMQFDIAKKLIARDPWVHPWKGNDADLQGSMLFGERELTQREKMPPEKYLTLVLSALQYLKEREKAHDSH